MKRAFDLLTALFLLMLFLPLLIITLIIIIIVDGTPVFFKQQRPGYKCKPFILYKLRTMNDSKDDAGQLLPDVIRLTKTGKLIRKLSLDEVPQLFNVLKGDMSLVGPRPLLMEYVPLYNAEQARRHDVKPGITGWAQVNGRNNTSWDERFANDIWYVDNQSFWLDMKILVMTVISVFSGAGVEHSANQTMPKFTGNKEIHE